MRAPGVEYPGSIRMGSSVVLVIAIALADARGPGVRDEPSPQEATPRRYLPGHHSNTTLSMRRVAPSLTARYASAPRAGALPAISASVNGSATLM